MSLSISAAAASVASPAQAAEQAKLNQMVAQYRSDLKNGSQQTLAALSRQIATAAQALGQTVVLPTASSTATSAAAAPPAPTAAASAVAAQTQALSLTV